jgi:hypothetical protein
MTISRIARALTLVLLLAASAADAHPPKAGEAPHSHGPRKWPPDALSRDEVTERAKAERDRLIVEKKIEAAWQSAGDPVLEEKWSDRAFTSSSRRRAASWPRTTRANSYFRLLV